MKSTVITLLGLLPGLAGCGVTPTPSAPDSEIVVLKVGRFG